MIQAAIHYRPIRHLVVALGAAYESLEDGGYGTQGMMELALQQCNRSIQELAAPAPSGTQSQSQPSQSAETLYTILTASILFIYFACVRGRMPEAIQHVQSAVRLLRDLDQLEGRHRAAKESPSASGSYPVPASRLRALLVSVYGQLRTMINDIAPEEGAPDPLVSDPEPATVFASFAEAHAYVERLSHNVLAFLQDAERRPPVTDGRLGEVVARHEALCRALESSRAAVDALAAASSPDDPSSQRALAVLRLHQTLLAVRLRIDVLRPAQRESAFDELEAYLGEMLAYCEFLCGGADPGPEAPDRGRDEWDVSPGRRRPPPSCSSGLGCVVPLYTIAARCRNPALRRRAVQLLSECSRREGIWDAALAATVASQAQALEEESRGGDDSTAAVQGDERVREVKIELRGDNSAVFQFVTVRDWKRGQRGAHKKLVEWETAL